MPFSDTSQPDIPQLRKAVEWVEVQNALTFGNGREWDQAHWSKKTRSGCGTTYCVAGHIVQEQGWKILYDGEGYARTAEKDGETRFVAHIAADVLGITASQATQLFMGTNTAYTVRMFAEEIAGERL